MSKRLNISYDSDLLEAISSDFDLRAPNKKALRQLVFTLDGDYDPAVMQVLNLATGVGKTYLMAAFVEYLRHQGINNVVIVTPGKTVQAKTVQNFTNGSPRYIAGFGEPPEVVTPQDYSAWTTRQNSGQQNFLTPGTPTLAFIFNIQQLIAPKSEEGDTRGGTQEAMRRKTRRFEENSGVLFDYLKDLDDLVVIADESHLYGSSAKAFNAALKELDPAAAIGLTASADKRLDHVIFEYPLYRAIQDRYVKAPVLAFRKGGYGQKEGAEEQQLRDAMQLREQKQAYYDSHASAQNLQPLNAVMFVVCADVDHATQTADLLRSPEFFGNADAVLQVDSKHEDEITQRRLEELDQQWSPVKAVVSVNKLKEGWDVKNIAVIVTLRAMASEVLTQQTMGRGLRLPFGRYTDVWQIDQLDIIAHQSFKELLDAENVLQQFGLEDAVSNPDPAEVRGVINQLAGQGLQGAEAGPGATFGNQFAGSTTLNTLAAGQIGGAGTKPSVGFRTLEQDGETPNIFDAQPEFVTIERNPRFDDVTYKFPGTMIISKQPPIDLSEISNSQIEEAARRVTSTGDVLFRKEIIAVLGKRLRAEDRESAEVESVRIPEADAVEFLRELAMRITNVPKTVSTARYVENFLVPKFCESVSIEHWTQKALASANDQLRSLIENYVKDTLRGTREVSEISPKQMPGEGYTLPLGERVYDQIETGEDFVPRRYYGGWFKSLFTEESFDSYSGEYVLAKLLNTSPNIEWWHRLHPQDGAYVYYTAKDKYFPDFVARDTDGVYWIIEGKDARGREDEKVQAKRKAAETLVRRLAAEEAFAEQNWGYLIAYEDDTKKVESWDDLKALSQPVSNVV